MSAFKSAFAAARKSGKKVFTWEGKRYTTKLAASTPKTAPRPTPKPAQAAPAAAAVKRPRPLAAAKTAAPAAAAASPSPQYRGTSKVAAPAAPAAAPSAPAKKSLGIVPTGTTKSTGLIKAVRSALGTDRNAGINAQLDRIEAAKKKSIGGNARSGLRITAR
ncbi:hypothetical protein NKH33_09575 [Mesorhizobium sp. M1182]|uniref:hypothetical protein n=1 Tax=Mesorhizobium sp. M1182 TaxID=2957067 RepID=UPI0033362F25